LGIPSESALLRIGISKRGVYATVSNHSEWQSLAVVAPE
jgi:hypothetical protein